MYSHAALEAGLVRIGELSRRSGVSPELLRAWERRYGVLRPARSAGGLRLYSPEDLERVRVMQRHLAAGLAAAEAAALALRALPGEEPRRVLLDAESARDDLAVALDRYDEPRAQTVIDELLAALTVDRLLSEVMLPYLHELGDRWERGEVSVAQEHFASGVLRGRLLGLARGWGRGLGPAALLACLPGEQHEFGLIVLGLALRARGWRIRYLGADTPLETLADAARSLAPELVVASAVTGERVRPIARELGELAGRHRLVLGGEAAEEDAAHELGALLVPDSPVLASDRLTALFESS